MCANVHMERNSYDWRLRAATQDMATNHLGRHAWHARMRINAADLECSTRSQTAGESFVRLHATPCSDIRFSTRVMSRCAVRLRGVASRVAAVDEVFRDR